MYTFLGIVSILAGVFVFRQGTALTILSSFSNSLNNVKTSEASAVSGTFLLVAIMLILGGALSCASKSGTKKGLLKACGVIYLLGFLLARSHSDKGDLGIWTYICLFLTCVYFINSFRSKNNNEIIETEIVEEASPTSGEELQFNTITLLERINELHKSGGLTDEEFYQKKREILSNNSVSEFNVNKENNDQITTDKDAWFCPNCGKQVGIAFSYCPNCGNEIIKFEGDNNEDKFINEMMKQSSMISIWKKWNEYALGQSYKDVDSFIMEYKEAERLYGKIHDIDKVKERICEMIPHSNAKTE